MKNIAINLLHASSESQTGSFVYIKNLLEGLLKIDNGDRYYLILNAKNSRYFKKRYSQFNNVLFYISDFRQDIWQNPLRAASKLLAKVKKDYETREKILRNEIQQFVVKNKIELVFFPSGSIYPKNLSGVKIVTTILDVQHEYFPENFSKPYLVRRKQEAAYAVTNSDRIIAISEFTKRSLIEKYQAKENKISVIYLASSENLNSNDDSLKLPAEFIFYPAAIWPHKNHKVLIRSLNLLKDHFPALNLVLTGLVKNKSLQQELNNQVQKLGLEERVHFLGFVSEDLMPAIYKKAKALVYPSSFEGFGIPIVEAFKFGLPVVAANNTSIGEIVGSAGVLVKTGDVSQLADSVKMVLTDSDLKNNLIQKGHKRLENFSWAKTATKTLDIFNSL